LSTTSKNKIFYCITFDQIKFCCISFCKASVYITDYWLKTGKSLHHHPIWKWIFLQPLSFRGNFNLTKFISNAISLIWLSTSSVTISNVKGGKFNELLTINKCSGAECISTKTCSSSFIRYAGNKKRPYLQLKLQNQTNPFQG